MPPKYVARHTFKYGGVTIKKGEIWEPDGGRYDEGVIKYHTAVVNVPARSRKKSKGVEDGEIPNRDDGPDSGDKRDSGNQLQQ